MAILDVDKEAERSPTAPEQFVLDSWISTAPFEDLLDLRIVTAEQGRAVLRMPFKVKHCQGGGLMHGGAMTTLADTAVAMAMKSLLPEGTRFATIKLEMEFLAPVRQGGVSAEARIEKTGERTYCGTAVVLDDRQRPVARFNSTFKVARNQRPEP